MGENQYLLEEILKFSWKWCISNNYLKHFHFTAKCTNRMMKFALWFWSLGGSSSNTLLCTKTSASRSASEIHEINWSYQNLVEKTHSGSSKSQGSQDYVMLTSVWDSREKPSNPTIANDVETVSNSNWLTEAKGNPVKFQLEDFKVEEDSQATSRLIRQQGCDGLAMFTLDKVKMRLHTVVQALLIIFIDLLSRLS